MTLSVRLSCDRCRAHKLKCPVVAGTKTCQRCERARATCVFGRRAPSKRKLSETGLEQGESASKQIPPCSPVQPSTATPLHLPTPPSTIASAPPEATSASGCPALSPEKPLESSVASTPMLQPIPEIDPGCVDDPTVWEGPSLGSYCLGPNPSGFECNGGTVTFDWLNAEPDFSLKEPTTFDLDQSDFASCWSGSGSHVATTPTTSLSRPEDGSSVATGDSPGSTQSISFISPCQQLTNLVSDIQQQLRTLEESPWHTNTTRSLADYPVGTILSLAQQLSALAGPILSKTSPIDGRLDDYGRDDYTQDRTDTKTNISAITGSPTPTMLLIMCGYIWLVRIYTVVLSHFQQHLKSENSNHHNSKPSNLTQRLNSPPSVSMNMSIPTAAAGAGQLPPSNLRLSDLSCADNTDLLTLQQVYTAVRMLLDAMHEIETHLGRGGAVARAMAIAMLLNPSSSSVTRCQDGQDACWDHTGLPVVGTGDCSGWTRAGLERLTKEVKGLLREKMGL